MATPGQTIANPVSGERITFRTTAAESGGELLAIDLELAPGGRVPGGLHVHPLQEERFEVVSGRMRFPMRREIIFAGPGDVLVVPAGVPHSFANAGDENALVRVEVRPALKMEQLFETAVALAEEGRTMLNGIPKPLELALFTREFEQEVQAAFLLSGSNASPWHRLPGSRSAAATTLATEQGPPGRRPTSTWQRAASDDSLVRVCLCRAHRRPPRPHVRTAMTRRRGSARARAARSLAKRARA
jgi:mannose-6-phosphate isomerase-like protein (cupin superfamily)